MAYLIKAPISTQGNECIIHLEISLNVNVNGQEQKPGQVLEEKKEEEHNWPMPEFDSSNKINFGKEKS
jgi:hypothetical protein